MEMFLLAVVISFFSLRLFPFLVVLVELSLSSVQSREKRRKETILESEFSKRGVYSHGLEDTNSLIEFSSSPPFPSWNCYGLHWRSAQKIHASRGMGISEENGMSVTSMSRIWMAAVSFSYFAFILSLRWCPSAPETEIPAVLFFTANSSFDE